MFALRIDTHDDEIINGLLNSYTKAYVYGKEEAKDGSNPHTQFYIELKPEYPNETAIRQYIQRNLGTGNGAYSLKKLHLQNEEDESYGKPVQYIQYIMKQWKDDNSDEENVALVINGNCHKGIDHNTIVDIYQISKQTSQEVEEKKKKKKSTKVWEQIMDSVDWTDPPSNYLPLGESRIDYPRWVIDTVLKYYKEKRLAIRDFQIRSTVQTILFHVSPSYESHLRSEILNAI